MARPPMTLGEIRASRPNIDRAKIAATTEADIRRHQTEDGEDPEAPLPSFRPAPDMRTIMTNSALEAHIDQCVQESIKVGYDPTRFRKMRAELGTVRSIEKLVVSPDIRAGFKRAVELGIVEWTLEEAVLKFPDDFRKGVQEAAAFRLDQIKKPKK